MEHHAKIGVRQFQILIVLFTVGTTVLITPGGLAASLRQDAWIAPIAALVPGLLIVMLFNRISRISPGVTLFELCDSLFGPWVGRIMSLLFVMFSFLASAMVLFDVGRFITTVIMPETPIMFINALFAFMLVYAVRKGFDTLARMVELLFPIFLLLLLLMIVFVTPQIDFRNALPFLEGEANEFIYSTLLVSSFSFMPLVVFLTVQLSELKNPEYGQKAFISAAIIGGVISIVIVAFTILSLGSNIASLQEYPVYYLTQKISIGKFLERIEAIVAGMWLMTTFVKTSLYFYTAISGVMHITRTTSVHSLLLPMGFLLVMASIVVFPNSEYEDRFNASGWLIMAAIAGVLFPLLLVTASIIKQLRKHG